MWSVFLTFIEFIPGLGKIFDVSWKIIAGIGNIWDNYQKRKVDKYFDKIDKKRDVVLRRIKHAKSDKERAKLLYRLNNPK